MKKSSVERKGDRLEKDQGAGMGKSKGLWFHHFLRFAGEGVFPAEPRGMRGRLGEAPLGRRSRTCKGPVVCVESRMNATSGVQVPEQWEDIESRGGRAMLLARHITRRLLGCATSVKDGFGVGRLCFIYGGFHN